MAMNQEQRKILREHHDKLVEGMDQMTLILDKLYSEKVLSDAVVKSIKRERDPQEQNRMLLSSIKKRPPPDFEKFVRVLCLTDNEHLAELLIPGSSSRYMNTANPLPPYNLPEVWPDEERLKEPVLVRPVTSDDMKNKYTQMKAGKGDMYRMGGRSRAIIISNTIFHDQRKGQNRDGNQKDEDRMTALLEKLNFDVEVWPNQTEDELFGPNGKLSTESRVGSDQYNCFLMVILTHGQKDQIMTADNQYVQMSSIVDYFDTFSCSRFAGKPKIYFVQACQGTRKDDGNIPNRVADVTECFMGMNIDTTDAEPGVQRPGVKYADLSDVIVANATVPGYVAWRNATYGTWFIQAIVEVFSNCACDSNLEDMLKKVNKLVRCARSTGGDHVQLTNISTNTLNDSVYFFPGLNRLTAPQSKYAQKTKAT